MADTGWQRQLLAVLAAYDAHCAWAREAFEKRLADVRSRENAARSVARDDFRPLGRQPQGSGGIREGCEDTEALLRGDASTARGNKHDVP
jgi:hypothetical protein